MPRRPQELVKKAQEHVEKLDNKKSAEEFEKCLAEMKAILYGTRDNEPSPELVSQLATELTTSTHLLISMVINLKSMSFEARKDVVQVFSKLLRREVGGRMPTVDYICSQKPEILTTLCEGYSDPDIALSTGLMLRECIKQEPLARIVLNSRELFDKFFGYVQQSQFDIASDAFATFKDLLTRHKIICASFLEENYDAVFGQYQQLLLSDNYVTKRQSLKLLGELLLDRANFTVMTKYIGNPDNLKTVMNMLREKSRNIQFEAFHVFKIFVANPNKNQAIKDILIKNKDKLVKFLKDFHSDRAEDEQFSDEKDYLIKQIKSL